MENEGKQPRYKNLPHFIAALLVTVLIFAVALSTLLTLVLYGLPIIAHGVPMCMTLAEANMLDRFLYTSCGCAAVELILLPLSLVVLRYSTPRLYRQFLYLRQLRNSFWKNR